MTKFTVTIQAHEFRNFDRMFEASVSSCKKFNRIISRYFLAFNQRTFRQVSLRTRINRYERYGDVGAIFG